MPVYMCLSLALTITFAACSQGGPPGAPDAATPGQGALDGSTWPPPTWPTCLVFPECNTGDQQVTAGLGSDYSGSCPADRDCYSLTNTCGSALCMLPEGGHCDDPLLCNPGDTPTTWAEGECQIPTFCYTNRLCTHTLLCRASANQYAPYCSGTWSDAGILEPPDASADGGDAGRLPCCGDGTLDLQYGEQCDFGPQNGVFLGDGTCEGCHWVPLIH
jgi:hypothetical protein